MHVLRPSSLEEYASWYLDRERLKGDDWPTPSDPRQRVQMMWQRHEGKMRSWFTEKTRWHLVLLGLDDVSDLVFLESCWTKCEGLVIPGSMNYRLLGQVAENAKASDYFSRPSAHKHKVYYDILAAGSLRLEDNDRVAVCSAEESEIRKNPKARHYLLDGVGRCLPYMVLTKAHAIEYRPVESFLAER